MVRKTTRKLLNKSIGRNAILWRNENPLMYGVIGERISSEFQYFVVENKYVNCRLEEGDRILIEHESGSCRLYDVAEGPIYADSG